MDGTLDSFGICHVIDKEEEKKESSCGLRTGHVVGWYGSVFCVYRVLTAFGLGRVQMEGVSGGSLFNTFRVRRGLFECD